MLDSTEYLSFLRLVQTRRNTTRESLLLACLYAAQLLIAAGILFAAYDYFHAGGVMWAIVSAVLCLQPGLRQSIAASAVRIAANIVGGSIAFLVGYYFGTGALQMLAALALVILACELLRLDLGLRTACVATLIVLSANEGHVNTSAIERLAAVLIGCFLAILLQLFLELLRRLFGWKSPANPAAPPSRPDTQNE
jgi:uncharacterized membrane protein YgaE (UPF0421/DUF939 family)